MNEWMMDGWKAVRELHGGFDRTGRSHTLPFLSSVNPAEHPTLLAHTCTRVWTAHSSPTPLA